MKGSSLLSLLRIGLAGSDGGRVRWSLFGGAVLAVGILYFWFNPTMAGWPLQCPVHLVTGWQCPGCGFQRALHALLHGEVVQALRYNLFLIVSMPLLLGVWAGRVLPLRWGLPLQRWVEHRLVLQAYLWLMVVWMVVRNVLHI